jgi:hypothetical protein
MAIRAENLHSLINQEKMELTNREPMQHRLEPKPVNMCFTWTCFRAAHNTSAAKLVPSLPLMFASSAASLCKQIGLSSPYSRSLPKIWSIF